MSDTSRFVRKIQPGEYDVFVGMDVDSRSIALCHIDQQGEEKSVGMPHQSASLLSYVGRHFPGKRLAFVYEAGPTGFGLHDALCQAGYPCLVVNPAAVPTPRGQRVRTNRLDARKLARQLRGGSLEGIRVPTDEYRLLREYVQLRKMHILQAARCKQRIKALFLRHGLSFPAAPPGGYWGQALIRQVREYTCTPALQFKIGSLLDSLEFSLAQATRAQAAMRSYVAGCADLAASVEYAMSLPGVGWIVASYAVARIGDWRLLGTSMQTASFFGLTQREDSTGEGSDRGAITKAGDPVMRSLLIQAAWAAIRKDEELRGFYKRVVAGHGRDKAARIAIVAVAHKLACRLHCVLKERRCYQIREEA
jgi:transposase